MSPRAPVLDSTDVNEVDAIFGRDDFQRPRVKPNGTYLGFGEFGVPISVAAHRLPDSPTSSLNHVLHVLLAGANRQVRRIYARAVMAAMSNIQSWRNRANEVLVGKPMRTNDAAPITAALNNSVAGVLDRATPEPTRISFLNLLHKALKEWSPVVSTARHSPGALFSTPSPAKRSTHVQIVAVTSDRARVINHHPKGGCL